MGIKGISLFILCYIVLFCSCLVYSADSRKPKTVVQVRYESRVSEGGDEVRSERSTFYTKLVLNLEEGLEFSFAGLSRWELLGSSMSVSSDYSLFSFGLYVRPKGGFLKMLALGNYILSIGQELVFGSPYYNSIYSITSSSFKKGGSGIKSYVYPGASGSLMGSAFSLSFGSISVLSFFFANRYPLSAVSFKGNFFDISYEYLVTSSSPLVYDDRDKKTLGEFGMGINVSYKVRNFEVSGLISYMALSDNLSRSDKELVEDAFSGKELFIGSLHFDAYIMSNINIYGELALSSYYNLFYDRQDYGVGGVFGTIVRWGLFSYIFLFRYLDKKYHAPHSSEVIGSRRDELGFANRIIVSLYRGFSLQLLFDIFKPVSLLEEEGLWYYDYSLMAVYRSLRGLFISYIFNDRFKNYYSTVRVRRKHRVDIKYVFYNEILGLRFRYENIYSKRGDEGSSHSGNLFYIQSSVNVKKLYYLFARITYYNSEDYDASIYVYEPHLPYWYSVPGRFGGEGTKYDFIIKIYFNEVIFGIRFNIDQRFSGRLYSNIFTNLIYRW